MDNIMISYFEIGLMFIVIWIIYRIIIMKKHNMNILREIAINIFFVYFLAVLYFTIFKNGLLEISLLHFGHINLIPLRETIRMFVNNPMGNKYAYYNVIGNILLFMPLGFLIPMLFKTYDNFKKVMICGIVTSFAIEFIQYFTAMNLSDVDDIIFNTIGALLGLICYRLFYKVLGFIKIDNIISNIQNKDQVSLINIVVKPLSIMAACCLMFTFSTIYANTYSSKLSNKELAIKAFSGYGNGKLVLYKKFDKYKILINDNSNYIELCILRKVLNNRYVVQDKFQLDYSNAKSYYGVELFGDRSKNKLTSIVFGKNNDSESILITLNGKNHKEKLKQYEYFIAVFPHYEQLKSNTDIYDIYKNQESKDLKIKFYNNNGNINNGMKLYK